jgi:hypothetical protein
MSLFLSGYEKRYLLEAHVKGRRKSEFPIEVFIPRDSTAPL